MSVLVHIDGLQELEVNGKWCEAIQLLLGRWRNDKDNIDILLRAALEIWYVIVYWDHPSPGEIDGLNFKTLIDEVTEIKRYGAIKFEDNVNYLWIFGYMISLFPYYFNDFDGDIYLSEEKANSMFQKAFEIEPTNSILEILVGRINHEEKHMTDRSYFDGCTQIEEYFWNVFS